jgi:hypothetical protein
MEECLRKRRGRAGIAGAVAGGRQCILASVLVLRALREVRVRCGAASTGPTCRCVLLEEDHDDASMPIRVPGTGTRYPRVALVPDLN